MSISPLQGQSPYAPVPFVSPGSSQIAGQMPLHFGTLAVKANTPYLYACLLMTRPEFRHLPSGQAEETFSTSLPSLVKTVWPSSV